MEFKNFEFENSEFENLEFENLEFENSEFENLETENSEFENLETENLDLFADKVKVMIHLWALLVKLNNFTFGNKAVLCPRPQAGIEAGAWAELGKNNVVYIRGYLFHHLT